MKSSHLPLLAFIGCALIWGSTFLVIRVGNDSLPALWACSLRYLLATIVLTTILVVRKLEWPKGEALKAAIFYGVLEFGISMPLLYWGEKVVPSGLAAVLYATCPVSAMFAARAMGMEKLDPRRLAAAILAFLGVGVIFFGQLGEGGAALGLLFILLAAIAAPVAGLALERGPRQNAIGVNAVGTLVAFPMVLSLSLITGEKPVIPTTMREIFPVVYLAIAGSVGAFVLFAWLINHWRATTISFLGVIVPVIAVILGSIVRKETLPAAGILGALIVVVGVVMVLRMEAVAKSKEMASAES